VVVKPLIVSKKASVYDEIVPESTKGTAPTAEAEIQLAVTSKNPSLVRNCRPKPFFGLVNHHRSEQRMAVKAIVNPKARADAGFPLYMAIPRGASMKKDMISRSRLTTCRTGTNRIIVR